MGPTSHVIRSKPLFAGAATVGSSKSLNLRTVAALRVEPSGPVLRVILDRPERRNAFDEHVIAELADVFREIGDPRVVVVSGAGNSFSAGADIDWMRRSVDLSPEENAADALELGRMLELVDRCPAPVIARIHGHAIGGALGLIAACDVAVATEDTVFAFAETKLGLIPGVISPFVLRKIGDGPARRYFLTGERFSATEARRIGLISEIAGDLDEAVDRIVRELLTAGPVAVLGAKALVRDRPELAEAARRSAEHRAGEEGQEGTTAFLAKRRAQFHDDPNAKPEP